MVSELIVKIKRYKLHRYDDNHGLLMPFSVQFLAQLNPLHVQLIIPQKLAMAMSQSVGLFQSAPYHHLILSPLQMLHSSHYDLSLSRSYRLYWSMRRQNLQLGSQNLLLTYSHANSLHDSTT